LLTAAQKDSTIYIYDVLTKEKKHEIKYDESVQKFGETLKYTFVLS